MAKKQPIEQWQDEDAARLKALFSTKTTLSQADFGEKFDIGNQGYVWQLLNGYRPLNIDVAQKFAQGLNCSIDEFSPTLAGKIAEASDRIEKQRVFAVDSHEAGDSVAVRRIEFKISAGIAGFAVDYLDNGEGEPIYIGRDWLESRGIEASKLYATRVGGLSMATKILPDDVILVNTANQRREHGAVVAANHEGEFTVKRLKYEHRRWWLTSDNDDQRSYPPVECADGTYILGRVVQVHRDRDL